MNKALELAKQAGAVSYTNRHYPDRPYRTFGPEELQKFYTLARADLEAENTKLRKALEEMVASDEEAIADAAAVGLEFPEELLTTYKKARAALGETK